MFSKTDILGHKLSLYKNKKNEITCYVLSDHNRIKLEMNSKRHYRKYSNTWKLSSTLLSDQKVTKEIRGKIKNFLEFFK
jgi:hypothetical protein